MATKKVEVTGEVKEGVTGTPTHDAPEREVQTPKDVANENQDLVQATNSDVDKAGEEAAKRITGSREAFNVTDAILGESEDHGINVKRAQAASFGEEYDPKTDPELNPAPLVPAASQNQNNLKHPEGDDFVNPHASRNYLGQLI